MKIYNIKVNGIAYEVEVEEMGKEGTGAVQMSAPVRPVAAPAAPKPPTTTTAPATTAKDHSPSAAPSAGAENITAPMPGTVLEVRVTAGQAVKSGDILLILEAMKMENEIMAPRDGIIDTVQTAKGAAVNSNEVLITLK